MYCVCGDEIKDSQEFCKICQQSFREYLKDLKKELKDKSKPIAENNNEKTI